MSDDRGLPGPRIRLNGQPALRTFERFTGTRVSVVEGCGKDGQHIVRSVTYWFDENGVLIHREDPYPEQ